ncbi:MAG TPA: hypothetical protein VFK38_01050 [Candidatus Limnocylindrales bacterium]|nr:hypothetical protein [Candidatus Limnocylindrales bacterium]
MQPVTVQVITYAPTAYYHCQHCELTFQEMGIGERLRRQHAAESLPEDLGREFAVLSDWVRSIIQRYGARVHVQVIDAASIEGFLKSLRYRVGRYPAVIVNGREKRIGSDFAALEPVIERHLSAARQPAAGAGGA